MAQTELKGLHPMKAPTTSKPKLKVYKINVHPIQRKA